MRIKRRYSLDQSPLYKLESKKRLAQLLSFDIRTFQEIVSPNNYHVFLNEQGRVIQYPTGVLKAIHSRIGSLLKRVELPDYVHSKKGRSYISNALAHPANIPLAKTDISKFYPSTSFSTVFSLFHQVFQCSKDVAWQLGKLCCYRDHLPTGSPISGYVAFLAHQGLFDQIHELAATNSCKMTLLVDDISLSGSMAAKKLLYTVRGIIHHHGLAVKEAKSKTFPTDRPRTITGVVVTKLGLRVPNQRLLNIHNARAVLRSETKPEKRDSLSKSLCGRLQEAKNILAANLVTRGNVT